jgi:hypothetical protein
MPRSPSRDLVDRFTGNRAYFHRADHLRKWKSGVALAALGLTVGWLAVELSMPSQAAPAHSRGELANPHAAFDANCRACHAPHSPGEFLSNPLSVFNTHDRWQSSSSLTCTKCHAGPAHHAKVKDRQYNNDCANCHHDHNGRDHSLVRISDNHCTHCHQNLPAHVDGSADFAPTITGFTRDHPEFKPLIQGLDRRLKFSHALHMTAGLVYTADDKHPWSPEGLGKQLNTNVAARFAADEENRIQLKCGDCHLLDAGRTASPNENRDKFNLLVGAIRGAPRQSILPARSEGAYYLPVNFDVHCKICHPIRTPLVEKSGGGRISSFFVTHRRQPAALKTLLRGEYAARLAARDNPVLSTPPGAGGRFDPKDQPRIARFDQEINDLTGSALGVLLQNLVPKSTVSPGKADGAAATGGFACGKCHYATPESIREPPERKTVLPLVDRAVWFQHAKFNHVSHRGLDCAACHPGTADKLPPDGNVNESEPVLIASKKTCQACHSPAGTPVETPGWQVIAGGIRHSCTDCHRYHNGDHPLQGLGSARRDPERPWSLGEFLDGGKKQP